MNNRDIIFIVAIGVLAWQIVHTNETNKNLLETVRNQKSAAVVNTKGEPSKPNEPIIIKASSVSTTNEKISYTDRETNPETGEKEKAQVKIEKQPSEIWLNVNGKNLQIPSETREEYAFQNGQLQLTSKTTTKIDLTTPLEPTWHVGITQDKKFWGMVTFPLSKNLGLDVGGIGGKAVIGISGKL